MADDPAAAAATTTAATTAGANAGAQAGQGAAAAAGGAAAADKSTLATGAAGAAAAGAATAGAGEAAAKAGQSYADFVATLTGDRKDFAARYTSFADLTDAGINFRKANSSMIRVPGKDAKPEEMTAFRKAIGVPETADAYSFAVEGYEPTDADKAVHGQLAAILHANNVPASAAPALAKSVKEYADAQQAEADRIALKARETADADLRKEMGADYEPGLEVAKRAVRAFGDAGFVALLDTPVNGQKLGDNPAFIKAFMKIGKRMGEGDFIGAVGADQKQSLQSEMAQILRDNPPGTERYKVPAIQKRMREINEQLYGTGPAVGVGGRTY